MTQINQDQTKLADKTIDQTSQIPPMHQALQIALYDEYRARAVYSGVVAAFGAVLPFVNIVEAENRHIAELEFLIQKYGVESVVDDWFGNTLVEPTLIQNCEVGIAAEIDNIRMYDYLLPFAEQPDVRDAFYRLQAASFNNHLPAFRKCVADSYSQTNVAPQNGAQTQIPQNFMDAIKGLTGANPNLNTIQSLFQGMGSEFLLGAAAGAVVISLVNGGGLKELFSTTKSEEE